MGETFSHFLSPSRGKVTLNKEFNARSSNERCSKFQTPAQETKHISFTQTLHGGDTRSALRTDPPCERRKLQKPCKNGWFEETRVISPRPSSKCSCGSRGRCHRHNLGFEHTQPWCCCWWIEANRNLRNLSRGADIVVRIPRTKKRWCRRLSDYKIATDDDDVKLSARLWWLYTNVEVTILARTG